MKFSTTLASAAALAITVTAGPVAKVNPIKNLPENGVHLDKVEVIKDIPPEGVHITELDTLSTLSVLATGTTANDYLNGGCKDVILFYARGSTQAGNMVSLFSSSPSLPSFHYPSSDFVPFSLFSSILT